MSARPPRSMRVARSRCTASEAGFTLIEVLVSLVLLALVLALLSEGVRYARGTWQAAARLDELAGLDMADVFLRARLAEAMPLYEQHRTGAMQVLFTGTADAVSFVAPAPNGPRGAGLYRYMLEAAPALAGKGRALVVKLAPYMAGAAEPGEETPLDRHDLVRNLTSLSFRYFGRHELKASPAWHAAWTRTDAMPSLVEINVGRDAADGGPFGLTIELRLQTGTR